MEPRIVATARRLGAPSRDARPVEPTAVRLLLDYLKGEGVDAVFGIPGGPATPLFDALYHEPAIKTIATRHEAGAGFMAAAYARVSGRLGVCCLTTGPGTTNAITAVAAAKADSLPVLVISAQVATIAFGKGSLQDSTYDRADTVEMYKPITKMSAMVAHPACLATMTRQAIRLAMTGRRGPVHLNIPTDVMGRLVRRDLQLARHYRPGACTLDRQAIARAARHLCQARQPAILAGNGINLSGAKEELLELAELLSIPVATTPKAKGAFPESHPLALRVFGLASAPWAQRYLLSGQIDVLLVLGSSLHENSTQGWEAGLMPARALIQQDIEHSVIGRNYPVDEALVGDAKTTLRELLGEVRALRRQTRRRCRGDRLAALKRDLAGVADSGRIEDKGTPLKPQRVMAELNAALPEDALIFLDVGNHTLWALHYLEATGRNEFIHNWGEFAAMGSAAAGVIGGKLADRRRPTVAIVGDGGFAMNGMEVLTASTYGIPVVWVVLNDARFNCVHHGQSLQYAGRTIGTEFRRMDIAGIAQGLGAWSRRVTEPGQVSLALGEALACGRAAVIDVWIDADEVPPIHSRLRALDRFFGGEERS